MCWLIKNQNVHILFTDIIGNVDVGRMLLKSVFKIKNVNSFNYVTALI